MSHLCTTIRNKPNVSKNSEDRKNLYKHKSPTFLNFTVSLHDKTGKLTRRKKQITLLSGGGCAKVNSRCEYFMA